jgi:hypothetical protein
MEYRHECGRCHSSLTDGGSAYFCAHECTLCATCAREVRFVCPNCEGELVRRPRRGTLPGSGPPPPPSSEVTVRRALEADAEAVAPLFDGYRQFYRQAPDLPAARAFLRERLAHDQSVVLVAEDRGEMAGFTQLYPSFTSVSLGPIAVLNDLFVVPSHRRRGVGAGLLSAARAWGKEWGAHYLELSTAVDNPAQLLYEAAGWTLDREFLHYELPLQNKPPVG